ncbi:MAG: PLP-dependent aminotransferase family protein [Roseibium sp.]
MSNWTPDLSGSDAPRYLAIADAIEADLKAGRLSPGDRLPAQRQLAGRLGLDFTTVARAYTEARRRGILASRVGSGTFVTAPDSPAGRVPQMQGMQRNPAADFSMNLPPEPNSAELTARMQESFVALAADLVPLLRYQCFAPSDPDRQTAARWLQRVGLAPQPDDVQFAPGAQAAMAGILTEIARPGDRIACEAITYPGLRSLCGQLRIEPTGLPGDADGMDPDALHAACRNGGIKALYLNPTLGNPTTRTLPVQRRKDLAAVARHFGIPIIEDDAYGQLSRAKPPTFAEIMPELTWYVASLSKSLGAGLRLAHVVAPGQSASWRLARSLRTMSVMISPLTAALATRWIDDGTAAALLAHIRKESVARQSMAARHLARCRLHGDPDGFHLWLELENGWTPSAFVSQIRLQPIGVAEGDAFVTAGMPPNAVRLCLGGPHSRAETDGALAAIAATLASAPQTAATYF